MNLEDDFGDMFIGDGWAICRVGDYECTDGTQRGADRLNITLTADGVKCPPAKMFITERAAFRFKSFCAACGLTQAERRAIEGNTLMEIAKKTADKLKGRSVAVLFERGEPNETTGKRYMEAANYRSATLPLPAAPPQKERAQKAKTESAETADDLPF